MVEMFSYGHDFIVVPKAVENVPIAMKKMMKEDGSYHSIVTLCEALREQGYWLEPTMVIDERFIAVHYSFAKNGEESAFKAMLTEMGLVDMRASSGEWDKNVDEIDFGSLNGNEYGVFSELEMQGIPTAEVLV